jgi:translation initiation factor 6 (eIF-6)
VNEALEVERARLIPHRLSVEPQLDDVAGFHQFGCHGASKEKMLRVLRVAHADMTVRIHDLLARENAVGNNEILNDGIEIAHRLLTPEATHPPARMSGVLPS